MLGSHPKALTSCSPGKPETTAIVTVRDVLADADWVQWTSLNDLLPLLAEAAPGEFLDAVESGLSNEAHHSTRFLHKRATGSQAATI